MALLRNALLSLLTASTACASSSSQQTSASAGPDGGQPPTTKEEPIDPSVPGVRYVGRIDTRDAAGPRLGWPGVRVVARFSGTEARVKLDEDPGAEGPSRYVVIVDGAAREEPLVPNAGSAEYTIASALAAGTHDVELYRRTEGQVGTTRVLGFTFPSGNLLAPPPPAARRIEFVGDSETNGYGIEGAGPDCSFSGATQNERKAYPALVSDALRAEHATISFSGKGVLRNADPSDAETFGALYARSIPTDATSTWSFEAFRPDAVVVTLGGNDWERPDPNVFDPPDEAALAAKYGDLVADIRKRNASATIFCVLPASLSNEHPEGYDAYDKMKRILDGVVAARASSGDTRVAYVEPPRAEDADRTGCDYHYGPAFHAKIAEALAAAIRVKMGW